MVDALLVPLPRWDFLKGFELLVVTVFAFLLAVYFV